jgi:polysaccharide export outer membrane protein
MKLFLSFAVLLLLVSGVAAQQQQQTSQASPSSPDPIPMGVSNSLYQIGPGDVLDIRVLGHAEFTNTIAVQPDGKIRIPFFEGDIDAACKTEQQVQDLVREKLLTLLKRPMVSVMVKEYLSRRASVVGAVRTPAQFKLQHRARLLDLLNAAGGATPTAGNFVNVVAPVAQDRALSCDDPDSKPAAGEERMQTIDRKLLESGDPSVNRYVRLGEVIEVPEAGRVYLTGAVNQPIAISLTTKLTLTQAIAMASGAQFAGKKDQISIIRSTPDGQRPEMKYNLAEIQKNPKTDPLLQENDVIFIPTSGFKNAMQGFSKSVVSNPTALRLLVF